MTLVEVVTKAADRAALAIKSNRKPDYNSPTFNSDHYGGDKAISL